jgi:hypothetical protein
MWRAAFVGRRHACAVCYLSQVHLVRHMFILSFERVRTHTHAVLTVFSKSSTRARDHTHRHNPQ